ncbi:MAG TPA: hypothetical protein VFS08_10165 [Gemmatimonadaceae bacterium]|nr:hypothetical protein [Gemmatimonadaceae bacterium]
MMRLSSLGRAVDWKHVLGELSLIVFGVLIALAADSWWDDRNDRRRERAYLQQLLSDIRETEKRLEYSISGDSAIRAQVERFLDVADTATAAPPVDSIYAWTVIDYRSFQPLTGTYDALIHNGNPELVSDDTLRLRIISYAADVAAAQEVLRHTETLIWRNLERRDLALLRHRLLPSGERRWRASLDVDAFLRDADLLNAASMQRGASTDRVVALRKLRKPTTELQRLLEAELGRSQATGGETSARSSATPTSGYPRPRDR